MYMRYDRPLRLRLHVATYAPLPPPPPHAPQALCAYFALISFFPLVSYQCRLQCHSKCEFDKILSLKQP